MELMFGMFDKNSDGSIDASELDMLMEMGEDEHDEHAEHEGHVGYATIHIEEEGDYGFALPMDVEFYILMDGDAHGGHDHDDHSDEEEDEDHDDHGDEEMVCYDMSSHTVDASYTTEADCEAAGLMWTAANSGPGGDDDDHGDHSDEEIEFDPHSWLDPLAFKMQVDVVKDVLITNFPDEEATFNDNAEAYKAQLDELHIKFDSIKVDCEERTVVANHNAYSYIAQRYGVDFVTIHGLDPEGEPTAADIAEVIEQIEEDGLTVLFIEEYTNMDSVAGLVEQTTSSTMPDGISIEILYTMELPPKDSEDNYLSLMEKNLENLKSGMNC